MEKEVVSLTDEERRIILETLGYRVNKKGFVCDKDGEDIICPFTNRLVTFEEASIMPGSLIIMNTTPLSLSEYFYQHPDE